MALRLWATPRNCSAMAATITDAAIAKAAERFPNLETQVAMMMWTTPQSNDNRDRGGGCERRGSTEESEGQTVDAVANGIGGIWRTEPNVGRVAYGVPNRVDRLTALGNAVVPQIPEIIGRAIMQAEKINA